MEPFRQWLDSQLGISPGLQDALVLPLLAVLLVWLVREVCLLVSRRYVKDPDRRRFWRRLSFYLMVLLGLASFGGIWLTGLQRIAEVLGARTAPERERVEPLLLGAVHALIATAALAILLRLLWLAYGYAVRRLTEWCIRARGVRYQQAMLMSPARLRDVGVIAARLVRGALVLILLYFYVPYLLSSLPVTNTWGETLLTWVLRSTSDIGLAILNYLPNLVYLAIILLLVRAIMRVLGFVFGAVGKGEIVLPGFDPDWAGPTYKLTRVVAILLTIVISYPFLPGAGSEIFRGFSIFIGALVTIGSTSVVGNVISGVVLTYTRAFRIGDRIQIDDTEGDVLEKTLFVTRIRTAKNEEVTIPNGVVLGGRILNYSAAASTKGLILHIGVGLGYDVDWRRAHELLIGAAKITPDILEYPPRSSGKRLLATMRSFMK